MGSNFGEGIERGIYHFAAEDIYGERRDLLIRRPSGSTRSANIPIHCDLRKVLGEGETVVSDEPVPALAQKGGQSPRPGASNGVAKRTDEEIEALQNLEQIVFGADMPDASPELLKAKEERIAHYRKHKAEKGEPVDDLSDDECWEAYAQPIRLWFRVTYH